MIALSSSCGCYASLYASPGVRPQAVVDEVLSRYLVQTTEKRIVAYRRYRESAVGYFNIDELARLHWDFLYGQAHALPALAAIESDQASRLPHKNSTTE